MSIVEKEFEIDFDNLDDINFIISKNDEYSYDGDSTYILNYYQKVGLNVKYNDTLYEFILFLVDDCDDILVLGPGFLNPERAEKLHNMPVFDRHSWVNDFSQNLIYYNDPTRYDYDDLQGGWGVGTSDNWHLENISEIIKILARKITDYEKKDIIPYSNLYFFGSSMGGFMGIILSILIRNSTSIADIPQFNVFKWHYWNKLQDVCFDNLPAEKIYSQYSYRLNVFDLMQKENYIPNSYIVLDCSCQSDWNSQFEEFITNLDKLPYEFTNNLNRLHLRIDGKNRGHSVLKKNDTISLINSVISNEKNFNQGQRKNIKFKLFSELDSDVYSYLEQNFIDKNILRYEANKIEWDDLKSIVEETLDDNTAIENDLTIIHDNNIEEYNLLQTLKKYITCRIDIKNRGNKNNSVDVVNISDKEFSSSKPKWFSNDSGKGLILKSSALNLEFNLKCYGDGDLQIALRGLEFKKDKNNQRIPIFIDILHFEIDGEGIVDNSRVICHDKPVRYVKSVKSEQVVNIKIKWRALDKYSNVPF